jgi:hypothetical protein
MLGEPVPHRKGEVDLHLVVALAKIDDAGDRSEAIGLLGKQEIFAVLANRDALRRLFAKPAGPSLTIVDAAAAMRAM